MKRLHSLWILMIALLGVTPLFSQTQLSNSSCGANEIRQDQLLSATPVRDAVSYQFEVENITYGYSETVICVAPELRLKQLAELTRPGVTYDIRIRTEVNGKWSAYGTICQVTTEGIRDVYCVMDKLEAEAIRRDPSIQDYIDDNRKKVQKYIEDNIASQDKDLSGCTLSFTIPVVFHIVHNAADALGVGSNIADTRVMDQLQAMNDEFNLPNPATLGVNTCIQFCLAQNTPTGAAWTSFGSSTPGITRTGSAQTNHITTGSGPSNLLGAISFPNDEYLNIWVVSTIDPGSGIIGYSPYPLIPSSAIDGIVIRNSVVGTGLTPPYHQGKVMVHELGHYLGLYHTFQAPAVCGTPFSSSDGDFIPDTPVALDPNYGCQTGASGISCGSQDQVQNHMDYSDDACKTTWTQDQTNWMHSTLTTNLRRSNMVSMFNLLSTGVAGALGCVDPAITSDFAATPRQACTVTDLITLTGAGVYDNWTFTLTPPSGSPTITLIGTGTPSASTTLPTAGAWDVQLLVSNTVTLPLGTSNTTLNDHIFASVCTPINDCASHWYFGNDGSLDFSSGTGASFAANIPNAANPNGNFTALEACNAISDPLTGNLQFYTNGRGLWSSAHAFTPNGGNTMNGSPNSGSISSHKGVVSIPNPNTSSSTDYFIFTTSDRPTLASTFNHGLSFYEVDMSLNGGLGDLVSTTAQFPTQNFSLTEPVAAVSTCDGSEYWIIVHGANNNPTQNGGFSINVTSTGAPIAPSDAILSYKVDASGVSGTPVVSDVGAFTVEPDPALVLTMSNEWIGSTKFSLDRSLCAMQDYANGQVHLYDFDPFSGQFEYLQTLNAGATGVEFSPSGEFLYTCGGNNVSQYDLRDLLCDIPFTTFTLPTNYNFPDLELGPDNKLYLSQSYFSATTAEMTVINYPDLENTGANPNAFGLNFNGLQLITNTTTQIELTNTVHKLNTSPLDFEFCVENCFDVSTRSLACGNAYAWDFDGDNIADVGVDGRLETFTFPGAGNYPVTLWVDGAPITHIIQIIAPPTPLIVPNGIVCQQAFPVTHSLSNAGAMPAGSTYAWSVTGGGSISGPSNGASVDVTWASNGTITVIVTDPNGCSSTNTENITIAIPPTIVATVTDASCGSSCDGAVTTVITGAGSYNFTWVDVSTGLTIGTTQNISSLCAGDYQLTVVDGNGCVSSILVTIGSGAGTLPSLTMANITLCDDGTNIVLAASGILAGTTVEWYAPGDTPGVDPPIASGSPTSIPPLAPGTYPGYQVIQCDAFGCCSAVTLFTITIIASPPAVVLPNITICASGPLDLIAPTIVGATLEWYFPGANVGVDPPFATGTPSFTGPFAPGVYAGFQVRMCLNGCCGPVTVFNIIVLPDPPALVVPNITLCEDGSNIALAASGVVGGTTVEWYAPGDIPGVDPPIATGSPTSIPPLAPGIYPGYQVIQCFPSGCCSPITTFTITINITPPAVVLPNITICESGPLDLIAPTIVGATLEWYFPGANVGVDPPFATGTPSFTGPFAPGTYAGFQVRMCLNGCCGPVTVFDIIVLPEPPALVMADVEACEDGAYTLSASGVVAGATVEWYAPGDVPGVDPPFATGSPSYTGPFTVGVYTGFQVRQCFPSGCCGPITTFTITINPTPPALVLPNITACASGPLVLTAPGAAAGATVEWYLPWQVVGVNTPFATGTATFPGPFTPGTYAGFQVRQCFPLTGCCSPVTVFDIIIIATPPALVLPNITACETGPLDLIATGAIPGATIEWYAPGSNPAIDPPFATGSPSYPGPFAPGTYTGFQVIQCIGGCCSPVTTFDIIIEPVPPAIVMPNITVCQSGSYTFTAPGVVAGATVEWYTSTQTPGIDPPIATGSPAGPFVGPFPVGVSTFQVRQCLPSGCCSPVTTFTVTVTPDLPALVVPNITICASGPLVLTAPGAAVGATVEWYLPWQVVGVSTPFATGTGTFPGPFTPGTYTGFQVVQCYPSGCCSPVTVFDIIVITAPPALVMPNITICEAGPLTLSAPGALGGATIEWYAPGSNPAIDPPFATGTPTYTGPFAPGTYTGFQVVQCLGGCCSPPVTFDIIVTPGAGYPKHFTPGTGTLQNKGNAVAYDENDGSVYLSGVTSVNAQFFPTGSVTTANGKTSYVAKYSSCGDLVWVQSYGPPLAPSATEGAEAWDIAIGPNGDPYVTGSFSGNGIDFGGGWILNTSGTSAYVQRIDPSTGATVWAIESDATGARAGGTAIAVDVNDDIYITGRSGSLSLPLTFGSVSENFISPQDIFTARFDNTGTCIWIRNLGLTNGSSITNHDIVESIAVDDDFVHVSGAFVGKLVFGAHPQVNSTSVLNDIYLASHEKTTGFEQFIYAYGSPTSDDHSRDMVVDAAGDVYLTGFYNTTVNYPGGASLTSLNGEDANILKINPSSGLVIWAQSIAGSNGNEQGTGIDLDANEDIYVCGKFRSDFVDFGSGVTVNGPSLISDGYIAKYDNAGNILGGWATSPNGDTSTPYDVIPWDIVVADDGTSYTTGLFAGTVDFNSAATGPLVAVTSLDGFIAKTDPLGMMDKSFDDISSILVTPTADAKDLLGKWYPNPADVFAYYEYDLKSTPNAVMEIIDMFGKVVYRQQLTNESKRVKIDLVEFVDGMYFYRVLNNGELLDEGKVVITNK